MADLYATLEVSRSANQDEIRASYKRLVKVWHPDKNPDDLEQATARFKQIQLAFQVLSDSNQRTLYDDIIRNQEQRQNSVPTSNTSCHERDDESGKSGSEKARADVFHDKWRSVRTEQSKREGRNTRVKHSIFGSVLRKNRILGSVGDDIDRQEGDQYCGLGKNVSCSRDVYRRHSILAAFRLGNSRTRGERSGDGTQGTRDHLDEQNLEEHAEDSRGTHHVRRTSILRALFGTRSSADA